MKKIYIYIILIIGMIMGVSAYTLDSNVTGYYELFNNAADLSSTAVDGVSTGVIYNGDNADFSGSNQWINFPTRIDTINPYSINGWFNPDVVTGTFSLFTQMDLNTKSDQVQLQIINGNLYGWTTKTTGYTQPMATTTLNIGNNYMATLTSDGTTIKLYLNGVLESTKTYTAGSYSGTSTSYSLGRRGGYSDQYYNGKMNKTSIFNITLTQTEITDIYNNGILNTIGAIVTINSPINNGYENTNPFVLNVSTDLNTNLSYSLNGASNVTLATNVNSSVSSITGIEGSNTIIVYSNYTGEITSATSNFIIDTINPNISKTGNLTNSFQTNFSDVLTFNDSGSGVASCFLNITELEIVPNPDNFYINCTDTQSFTSAGSHNFKAIVTDNAGNTNSLEFNATITPFVYIEFTDPSLNLISNYTATINHPDGRTTNAEFTNSTTIKLSPINNGTLDLGNPTINFVKYGYVSSSFTVNINSTSGDTTEQFEIGISLLNINIYDVDTLALITQLVDIDLIGDSFSGSFTTTNGSIIINNITVLPDIYELTLTSLDYEILSYYFQHTGFAAVNLNLYMQNTTTTIPIKYIVLDNFGDPYSDSSCLVELQIYQISSNSYESFAMQYTNSIGEVIFNLDTNQKYKAIITCGSITQVYNGEKITSTPVYKKISESNLDIFPTVPTISSDITFVQVSNTTGRFKFTYDDTNNIISESCLNITEITYNSETTIGSQCLATSSGSINVDFNATKGLTYKAYGFVTYEEKTYEVNTYYKKIAQVVFDFGIWGIIFGLVIIGLLSIGGFFMGKAKGVLIGATTGLWIASFAVFGVWFMPVSAPLIVWSVLLIVGVIFS